MSPRWARPSSPAVDVARGEKVLASASADDGTVLAGTRDAFYVVADGETRRVPWEQVEAADWDRDTDTFRLSEVGSWGDQRPVHVAVLAEPGSPRSSWCANGSPRASSCSATCLSTGAGACGSSRAAPPRAWAASSGSTSTTRASTPTTRASDRRPVEALEAMRRDVGLP